MKHPRGYTLRGNHLTCIRCNRQWAVPEAMITAGLLSPRSWTVLEVHAEVCAAQRPLSVPTGVRSPGQKK